MHEIFRRTRLLIIPVINCHPKRRARKNQKLKNCSGVYVGIRDNLKSEMFREIM